MTAYEEALRLFEEMDGLDDAFIEEGMLPEDSATARPERRLTGFFRRVGSSRWAAVMGGILAVGVLYALIRMGPLGSGQKSEDADAPADPAPMGTMKEEIKPEGDRVPEEEPLPAETDSGYEEETAEEG